VSGSMEGWPVRLPLIVAITGASGAVFGIRALELLRDDPRFETHLIISLAARATIAAETDRSVSDVCELADVVHPVGNIGATIASGSFPAHGKIVAPSSIRTLAAVAGCLSDNLVTRAADVTLKERRPLVLMVRETPLHVGHLRLMQQAAEAGATIMPPVPSFYHRPSSIGELVDQTVGRALDQLGIDTDGVQRWRGLPAALVRRRELRPMANLDRTRRPG
jgi:4-hydroxy-3-polyprenylbenzoate decarboxylase